LPRTNTLAYSASSLKRKKVFIALSIVLYSFLISPIKRPQEAFVLVPGKPFQPSLIRLNPAQEKYL
jgi:hypothetical protein